MSTERAVKPSNLPASAALLMIFVIVTWVFTLVVGSFGLLAPLCAVVTLVWAAKLLFGLTRWLKADKDTRPPMRFPRKTAAVLLVILLAVGYFGYLIARDLSGL